MPPVYQPGEKPWRISWDIIGHGIRDTRYPSAPAFAGWAPYTVRCAVPQSASHTAARAICSIGSSCANASLRRFVPDSSTAGGPIGLRGQLPPPGTDLSRVSAYHLPVQESQGTGASRHGSALK